MAKKATHRPWTQDEKDRFEELINVYPVDMIAQKMGRTRHSVISYARQNGFSTRADLDFYSVHHIAKMLNCRVGALIYWIEKRELNGKQNNKHATWRISSYSLKSFYKRKPNLRIWRKAPKENLDWLLGGQSAN